MRKSSWAFLGSTRFWAIVIGAVALALFTDGHISQAWLICVETIVAPFVVVRTVDRLGDKKVEAAEIAAGK